MTSRRSNRAPTAQPSYAPICALCSRADPVIAVRRKFLCLTCAWDTVKELGYVFNAPEITALERMKHKEEHGPDGPKRSRIEPGWVYYLEIGDRIKIGYAKNVTKRMRSYPPNAVLLAAHPGTREVEQEMQKKFATHLSHGREWFVDSPEIRIHIGQVVAQFGSADHMAYEYTRPKTQEEKVAAMFATRGNGSVARGPHFVV